jgi:Family of unknown function (DUF6356)
MLGKSIGMKIKHLEDNNQTYKQHMKDALKYSFASLRASWYFLVHALVPSLYTKEGSSTINELDKQLEQKKAVSRNAIYKKYTPIVSSGYKEI